MKRKFVVFICLLYVFILPVSAEWYAYMGYQPATDFAKIMYDYNAVTTDPRDMITALFDIEKDRVLCVEEKFTLENVIFCEWLIWEDYFNISSELSKEDIVDYLNNGEKDFSFLEGLKLCIYYYDYDGNNDSVEDADIRLYTTSFNNNYGYYGPMSIYINDTALDHIDDEMNQLLCTINTPQMLFDVCGADVPVEYYDIDAYHKNVTSSTWGTLIGDYFWTLNGNYTGETTAVYNPISNKMGIGSVADTPASDYVYLTHPYTAKILRSFNGQFYREGEDPTYGYDSFREGCERYELTVNYSAQEGIEEGDFLNYMIDNIVVEIVVSELHPDKISAPQTGFATVAYAAVAVVSAATAVAVGKKRR